MGERFRRAILPAALLAGALSDSGCRQEPPKPEPVDAVDYIAAAFRDYPIVALDEGDHQSRQSHAFFIDLIGDPRFQKAADDIAVEWASARLQAVLDAYVSGAEVPEDQVRQAWRETTQFLVWDSPVYQRFFKAVREVNEALAPEDRLRVLAGDPPIDWSRVRSHDDAMRFSDRDGHFAEVLEREVLAKNRRALVIAGGGHLYRVEDDGEPNLVQILEQRHPGKVVVIKTHDPESEAVEAIVSQWPQLSILSLRGSSLGQTDAGSVIPRYKEKGKNLEDVADAYLYIVPFNEMQKARPAPEVYDDEQYVREIERRYEVVFQEPFPQEVWGQLKGRR